MHKYFPYGCNELVIPFPWPKKFVRGRGSKYIWHISHLFLKKTIHTKNHTHMYVGGLSTMLPIRSTVVWDKKIEMEKSKTSKILTWGNRTIKHVKYDSRLLIFMISYVLMVFGMSIHHIDCLLLSSQIFYIYTFLFSIMHSWTCLHLYIRKYIKYR